MSRRLSGRKRRKLRIRRKVAGTEIRPRLSVFRSARHIYAQVIDDAKSCTVAAASTLSPDLRSTLEADSKTAAARKVGALIAKICLERKVDKVVFDRNGFLYHGRIKALADAARKGGLKF
jgi:large subunit ribosomal protein L18